MLSLSIYACSLAMRQHPIQFATMKLPIMHDHLTTVHDNSLYGEYTEIPYEGLLHVLCTDLLSLCMKLL